MHSTASIMRTAGAVALLALGAAPLLAEGKGDRAQQAIAEARGKVDAANRAGAANHTPEMSARAAAALRQAEEDVSAGHKEQAIADAHRASELADTAIGVTNKQRNEAASAQQDNAAAVDAAQASAADANARAADANARAENAANRADTAEQAAASATAQADALRNQPQPTTSTTTVVEKNTSHAAAARPAVHKVVRRTASTTPATTSSERTTTTVTTTPN